MRRPFIAIALALLVACGRGRPAIVVGGGHDQLPGAEPTEPDLAAKLADAVRARGPSYRPHTRHLDAAGHAKYTNRLILEKSPYLIQHAHNPVDWYPWGDEAFARARQLGRPVLLSIGYATCHWCHVMEEESWEDEEIAAYLNSHYVAIKVDREERPDVDAVYMNVTMAMTGSGGWPMNVWLTPDRTPFFAGTYFPPRDGGRGRERGLRTILAALADEYTRDPAGVATRARGLIAEIGAQRGGPKGGDAPGDDAIAAAVLRLESTYDPTHGGFGGAPKFPQPSNLALLLRRGRRGGDEQAMRVAHDTLVRMAAGGIRDQLAGGFHRYSTDVAWRTPHYEKMLYDNAQLAVLYLDAGLGDVARGIFADMLGALQAPDGGFYGASDADADGKEGSSYTWTGAQLDAALGADAAKIARAWWDVPEDTARSLATPRSWEDVAAQLSITPAALHTAIDAAQPKLLAARAKRPAPAIDTKILVGWNGLMIGALAHGALILGDDTLRAAAVRAAARLVDHARTADGRLAHAIIDGTPVGAAFLDDYAFLIAGLLDLFEADPDPRWLRAALALQAELDGGFADPQGGYFTTAAWHEQLIAARDKPADDNALPTGNSICALNLLRLADLTGDDHFRATEDRLLRAFSDVIARSPAALPAMLAAVDYAHDPRALEIVIVAPAGGNASTLLAALARAYLPDRVIVRITESAAATTEILKLAPIAADKTAQGGKATAYVCHGTSCELPTADPAAFLALLRKRP